MYDELVSVRGLVDLSPQDVLDKARTFLIQQGYTPVWRASNSLTVQRRPPDNGAAKYALNLTVKALPQPEGGVRVKVRGTDREGVQERQAAWMEWSEALPKKPEPSTDEPQDQQERTIETPDVPLLRPKAEDPELSTPLPAPSHPDSVPPGREPRVRRWVALALGGARIERQAVFAIGVSIVVGILLAIPLYTLGVLPGISNLAVLGSSGSAIGSFETTSEDVVQAFRDEGLEVGESYPIEEDAPFSATFPVPKTYKEATRFEIPSLGEDKGGRVFSFETRRGLERVKNYYQSFSGMSYSHVFVKDNILVQLNGELPIQEAEQYRAVLETM